MTMELTFLGTGAAYPSPQRGASSVVFRLEGKYWMFDCGEGTQIKLACSKVRSGKISKVFITHLHGDHMFGLPGFICTLSLSLVAFDRECLEIYGPQGLRKFIRMALQLSRARLNFSYVVHELRPADAQLPDDYQTSLDICDDCLHPNELTGSTIEQDVASESWLVFEDEQLVVKAGVLKHQIPCFGYVIEEKPKTGKLDAAKLMSLGIPPGKLYSKLKAGECITAPNGQTITPGDVLGPSQPGRKLAIMGDTCDSSKMAALCKDVSVLVHEATLSNEMAENAIEKGHSTPEMAASFAVSVNASLLVLTHFSQRYNTNSNDPENSVALLQAQAEKVFGANGLKKVIMAEDCLELVIKRNDWQMFNSALQKQC